MKYLFRKRRLRFLAHVLDGVGFAAGGFRSGRQVIPKNVKSILVVRLDHLGDVVRASALPQLVKETYPNAKLIFLTNGAGAELLEGNPYIDEIVVFNPNWYQTGSHQRGGKPDRLGSIVGRLKGMHIDLALLPRGDVRENLMVKMAGIPFRVGYGVTGGGFLLSRCISYRMGVHEDEHTLDVVRAIGVEAVSLRPRIYMGSKSSCEMEGDEIGIHLEAGTPAKEWSLDQKNDFLECCASDLAGKPLYFIGQSKPLSDLINGQISAKKNLRWRNLIGRTSIRDLKPVLSKTKIFVGFDSGPAHMAAAMGSTTLFIYSGTNELEVWKPTSDYAEVLANRVDCSPCHLTHCTVAGHPCLSGIRPSTVVKWIQEKTR